LLTTANTFTGGVQQITTASAATEGLIVRGIASQTADLQQWKNNAGTIFASIDSAGRSSAVAAVINGFAKGLAYLGIQTTAADKGLIIRGAASQTANLQEWQNSGGAVLAKVSSAGAGTFIGIASTSTNDLAGTTYMAGIAARSDFGGAILTFQSGRVLAITAATTLTSQAAASVGLIVKGAASQTANLTEWQNSAGTIVAKINQVGSAVFGNATINAAGNLNAYAGNTTTVPMVVRGAASQTADLQQWQDSAGSTLLSVYSTGTLSGAVGGTSSARFRYFDNPNTSGAYIDTQLTSGTLGVVARSTSAVTFIVRGAASQTANLQEWQNSGGTALAIVSSAGVMIAPTLQTTSALTQISEENSGGRLRLTKMSSSAGTTSTDLLKLYVVAGTLPGTLKLAVRAGTGAETTILDNIPQ
jgi:hypothetical protein